MATPKLRFKEFDGDWANISFQDLFTFKNGVNASKEQYGSGIKFINVLDIINNPNGITYESIIGSVDITSKEIDKNLVKYGDVLFQRSSETREEVGQSNVYLSNEPVVFGGFIIRGSAQKDYDPVFMNGLLKTDSLRDQITQLSGGSTRFNIGQDSLNKVSAYLPPKEEQTKIASFLSNVDKKISQLTQKYELLSQCKQGMMQKLFSQQIRFKADDGSEFGEWGNVILDDVILGMQSGLSRQLKDEDTGLIVLRSNNVIDNKISYLDIKFWYLDDPQGANVENYILEDGDILVNFINSMAQIGKSALYRKVLDRKIICTTNILRVQANKLKVKPEFLNFIFQTNEYENYIQSITKPAVNQASFTTKEFKMMKFKLPCLEEQTKIANFLSAIDQKIEVVAQQIEQAKQWKKGLLQQMFV